MDPGQGEISEHVIRGSTVVGHRDTPAFFSSLLA